jgi:hypothetical protein
MIQCERGPATAPVLNLTRFRSGQNTPRGVSTVRDTMSTGSHFCFTHGQPETHCRLKRWLRRARCGSDCRAKTVTSFSTAKLCSHATSSLIVRCTPTILNARPPGRLATCCSCAAHVSNPRQVEASITPKRPVHLPGNISIFAAPSYMDILSAIGSLIEW